MNLGVVHERTIRRRRSRRDILPRRAPGPSPNARACVEVKRGPTKCHLGRIATALLVVVAGLALKAGAEPPAYDLVIQRSPLQAGDVTPNTGAHRISANATVTLTANPEPGYRFAYWLGDVSDPASERTTVLVDQPKIVIAVFQPETQKRIEDQLRAGGGGGFDMLAPTPTDLGAPGSSPAGGAAKGDTKIVPIMVPVVIPEPTTVALLGLGAAVLSRRHRR